MSSLIETLALLLKLINSCTTGSDELGTLTFFPLDKYENVQLCMTVKISEDDRSCWTDSLDGLGASDELGGGCFYGVINFNDDYQNTPADCAKKAALCFNNSINDCTYGSPEHCQELATHCKLAADLCYASTL